MKPPKIVYPRIVLEWEFLREGYVNTKYRVVEPKKWDGTSFPLEQLILESCVENDAMGNPKWIREEWEDMEQWASYVYQVLGYKMKD